MTQPDTARLPGNRPQAPTLPGEDPWDGVPTYDPASGTIQIGRYADASPARWLLHTPGRGAASGVLAGAMASGKTSALRVIAAETMRARLCAACGAAGTCAECDLRPIAAVWMADPLGQAMGDFRSRAGLVAWGPYATVHMLIMLRAGIRARAASTGAARFDPAPGRPLITGLVDDWQWILDDPELTWLGRWAVAAIVREGPRAGAGLNVAVPSLDRSTVSPQSCGQPCNVLCGRTGGLSAPVLGIQGDTGTLPRLPGVGYLNGPDDRPGEVMRAKYLPGPLDGGQAGPDTGAAAGPIAQEHAALDEAFLAAVVPLGYTGPGQVLTGEPMKAALEFLASPAGTGLDIGDALRHITATGAASTGSGDSAGITAHPSDHHQDEHTKAGPIMATSTPRATLGNSLTGLVKDAWCMLRLPCFGVPMALVVAFAGWRGWSTFPRGGLTGHLAGTVLAGASYLLLVVLLAAVTVHLGRRPVRPALTAGPHGGGKTRLRDMVAAQVRTQPGELPDPPDMAGSLAVTEAILAGLRPGPENVRAADPAATAVRWDASGWREPGRTLNLPESRADKMRHICHLVRREAVQGDVLHRLPQLLLVADDGAVIELFGDRTGTLEQATS